jgi:hypothetical protein
MVIEKTGWSYHYVLWGISWQTVKMMIADAPKMVRKSKKKKLTGKEAIARRRARENG